MNRWLFGFVFALGLWSTQARAVEPFECIAEKSGVTYTVKLSGPADRRSLAVTDSRGTITSGRATVYRRGTRFFLPAPSGTGFKLGFEGNSASLCLTNGGNDCQVCEPIASLRTRYAWKDTCVTMTSRGRYSATLFHSDQPSAEMVIEDEAGEIASGPARFALSSETFARLQIGPTEAYTYEVDAGFLCTLDPYECYACDALDIDDNPTPMTLPTTILAQCEYAGIDALLYEQGGDTFLDIDYHQRESMTGSEEGWYAGAASYLGGNSWQFGTFRLSLLDGAAELCTSSDGCGTCVYSRAPLR